MDDDEPNLVSPLYVLEALQVPDTIVWYGAKRTWVLAVRIVVIRITE